MATQSFHETKNVTCGEGGALLINDASYIERAEVIREKGTNRGRFFRGQVDKYTWVDVGSSYVPSEICSAFLCACGPDAMTAAASGAAAEAAAARQAKEQKSQLEAQIKATQESEQKRVDRISEQVDGASR